VFQSISCSCFTKKYSIPLKKEKPRPMKRILIFISVLTFASSCDFPEHYFQTKPICHSESTDDLSRENQIRLVNRLENKNPADFRYFFKTFEEEGNNTFMITNFRNEESCFDIKILVNKWDKLAGMKRTNGVSYPQELYDLVWEIKSIQGEKIVEYVDMHKIID